MRGLRLFVVLAAASACLGACSHLLRVTEADPRPEVSLCDTSAAPSCPSLALVFAPDVADNYDKPEKYPIYPCRVEHWHATLEHAFRHTFAPYFHVTTTREPGGLALEILEADFDFVPTATFLSGKITGVKTRLHYRARLVRGDGRVIAESAGAADAKASTQDPDRTTDNVASAVESMYERLATELFPRVALDAGPSAVGAVSAVPDAVAAEGGDAF